MARFVQLCAFLALLGWGSAVYHDVSICCSQLAAQMPNTTFPRDNSNSSVYYTERTSFWAVSEWLSPTCVFMPESPNDVSRAVKIFAKNNCPFAIRGSGHSAIRGAANIDDGILISMKRINDITFSADKKTVTVGMGNNWGAAYAAVEKEGKMVVGGRFAPVGLGLALGAGLSYFSNERGLAVDNVAGQRVVLADGSIVLANNKNYSDLHWALKGGSNNFGVVTHLVLETVDQSGLYGGRVTYPASSSEALKKVVYNYQVEGSTHPDVHVLPTWVWDAATNTTYGSSPIAYLRDSDTFPPYLQPWLDVEGVNATISKRNFTNLATELASAFPDGLVQACSTFTVYPTEDVLSYAIDKLSEFCASFSHIEGISGYQTVMPFPPQLIKKAVGRNPLGFDRAKPGKSLTAFVFGLQFTNESDIPEVFPAWEIFIRTLQLEFKRRNALYPLIMITYSAEDQQVFESYGDENVAKLVKISKKYDPDQVFQRLVYGGQKLPIS